MVKPQRAIIDWYSFTLFYVKSNESRLAHNIMNAVNETMIDAIGGAWVALIERDIEWIPDRGRSPYSVSYASMNGGFRVYANPSIDHFLIEISGRGTEYLQCDGLLDSIIEQTHQRATRIDIALDIETDTTPKEFIEAGYNARFKSRSSISSNDGETEYVGSRKSERYCRVYRYADKHPRSHLLRCEFVYRKDNAKIFSENLVKSAFQLNRAILGCMDVYGFLHSDVDRTATPIDIKSYTPDRGDAKTLIWLATAVVPAFKKLVNNGVIENPELWVKENLLS